MLRYVLAVVTASVSLAGCNASSEQAGKASHTVKRPVMDEPPRASTSSDQGGSPSATLRDRSGIQSGTPAAGGAGPEGNGAPSGPRNDLGNNSPVQD